MSTTSLMTFAQFEQLPDLPGKHELIDGELVSMPPPELTHSEISKRIFLLLLQSLPVNRVWTDHTGFRIGDGWLEPDASATWPDQNTDGRYFLQAPMIAVEVLSPGEEIERKITLYFAHGALEVWVIGPKHRSFTVYRRRDDEVVRHDVADSYRSDAAQATIQRAALFD